MNILLCVMNKVKERERKLIKFGKRRLKERRRRRRSSKREREEGVVEDSVVVRQVSKTVNELRINHWRKCERKREKN